MPNLRLAGVWEKEETKDELAPLPFCPARPGDTDLEAQTEPSFDAIKHAEAALANAERLSESLDEMIEEDADACYRLSRWTQEHEDDGPRAA